MARLIKASELVKGDLLETPGGTVLTVKDIRRPSDGIHAGRTVVQGPLAWISVYDNDQEITIRNDKCTGWFSRLGDDVVCDNCGEIKANH